MGLGRTRCEDCEYQACVGMHLSVAILTRHSWHARRKIALLKIMFLCLPKKGLFDIIIYMYKWHDERQWTKFHLFLPKNSVCELNRFCAFIFNDLSQHIRMEHTKQPAAMLHFPLCY